MRPGAYPSFFTSCLVRISLANSDNPNHADITIKVGFYIQHWGDIQKNAMRYATWNLERLGVTESTLKNAQFEVDDCQYVAVDPKGVKREYGDRIEAFYHCNPKKRDTLIKQSRLVPDSYADMVEMYGKPVAAPVDQEVAA
jgi:hypothetical protein